MTNLYVGDVSQDGYLNGTVFTPYAGTKTSLPIDVEFQRLYEFIAVGGVSTRCTFVEILKNGERRLASEYTRRQQWGPFEYSPDLDVASVQIYYKTTSDTTTGLSFIDITIDSFIVENKINLSKLFTGLTDIPASTLNIDLDPNAERLLILDRSNASRLFYGKVNSDFVKVTLPAKFSIDPLLTCIILDDDLAYTGAILDGVIAETIDLSQ